MEETKFYEPRSGAQRFLQNLYSWAQALVVALTVLMLVFTFAVRIVGVDGHSMVPTLQDRDLMIVQHIGYSPKAGDVVVATQPTFSTTPIVKRVIAVGGQTVDIDYDTSTVYVDGVALEEPYLGESMRQPFWTNRTHIEVPEGKLCLMGDNRNHSTDSRAPEVGVVDERSIIGHVVAVLPVSKLGGTN